MAKSCGAVRQLPLGIGSSRMSSLLAKLACLAWAIMATLTVPLPGNLAAQEAAADAAPSWVYFGTYTNRNSKGIYASSWDAETGRLGPAELVAELTNPSFLALHPSKRFLYAVNETDAFGGDETGAVSALAIDAATGKLTLLNQVATGGEGPCHLQVDATGRHVLVANYGGGSLAVLPIEADGKLGERTCFIQHEGSSVNPRRQEGPHAHCINLSGSNRFAFAADLGLDKVLIYALDSEAGLLKPAEMPDVAMKPGAGPRHIAVHPSQRFAYVINEIDSTVTAMQLNADTGALSVMQSVSTLPEGFSGNSSTAEIFITPDGKFLYGSNRGHDSLAVFSINQDTGHLTLVEITPTGGRTPRSFAIDPSGRFLLAANQGSDNVVVFRIDAETGKLTPTGQTLEVPVPVSVLFR